MDSIGTAINAAVVSGVGFLLWLATRGNRREIRELRTEFRAEMITRFAGVDSRFESLEARIDARFGELEGRFDARFASLEGRLDARIDAVRADLNRLALAVGAPRKAEAGG